MDIHELQRQFTLWLDEASYAFQKVPGSAVLIRYVRSSYQNDPVRSALELVLVIFFIRYLLAPSYSTSKQNFISLRDDVRNTCYCAFVGRVYTPGTPLADVVLAAGNR
jgi:serine palmitoyltransferase